MASNVKGRSASTASPSHWHSTRVGDPKQMVPKTNLEAYNCVVRYNAHVDRRIMGRGMVQDIPTARQKTGCKDSNRGLLLRTWLISVLMSLSRSMEVISKQFPLPKVPLGIEIVA